MRDLSTLNGSAHGPHLIGGYIIGCIQLRPTGQMDGGKVATSDREEVCWDRLVVAGDQNHAIMRMAQGVDLNHGCHNVARNERIAHTVGRLNHAVTDVADGKDAWLPTSLVDAIADLLNQFSEVEGARVPHTIGTVNQYLRLGKIFFSPVHPQAKRVSLVIHSAKVLAT